MTSFKVQAGRAKMTSPVGQTSSTVVSPDQEGKDEDLSYFYPSQINAANSRSPTRVEPLGAQYSNGRLIVVVENIRLRWKGLAVTNALAYNTAAKSFTQSTNLYTK